MRKTSEFSLEMDTLLLDICHLFPFGVFRFPTLNVSENFRLQEGQTEGDLPPSPKILPHLEGFSSCVSAYSPCPGLGWYSPPCDLRTRAPGSAIVRLRLQIQAHFSLSMQQSVTTETVAREQFEETVAMETGAARHRADHPAESEGRNTRFGPCSPTLVHAMGVAHSASFHASLTLNNAP